MPGNRATTPRGFVVAAPASGSGKTTVTMGLLAALVRRGVHVSSAKAGPDYIDPAFHHAATGRPCVTLDPWAASTDGLRARAARAVADPGCALLMVEGAMGLFDGADDATAAGAGGTADVAAALRLPVVLVLDAGRMGQGAAAIVAGLAAHRPDVRVAAVILNRIGSERHAAMVGRAVETVLPVLGALPRDRALATPSRHLGLVQAEERADLRDFVDTAGRLVEAHVDLERLLALSAPLVPGQAVDPPRPLRPLGQRIAVARDIAFSFAYPHMIDDWRRAGAEVRFFSPLADEAPDPSADAVFLPGGYPELHAGRIGAAQRFLSGLAGAAGRGALIYSECGGYMVLGQGLIDAGGVRHRMAGLLSLETSFERPRRHLGYRRLAIASGPWAGAAMAHEFHYATTLHAEGEPFAEARDAAGQDHARIGLRAGRVMGSFAHVIELGA